MVKILSPRDRTTNNWLLPFTDDVAIFLILYYFRSSSPTHPEQVALRHVSVMLLLGCCITAGVVVNLLVQRLHQLATTDKLTGAYNRHTWDTPLNYKLDFARRYHAPLSLMIIDLDQFKKINDSKGHQQGDRVLQVTARCVQQALRSSDISARWGGDEFILLLHDCTLPLAHRMKKRLQKELSSTVSFTAGIAEFKADDTEESFLARADKQLLEKIGKQAQSYGC